MNHSLRSLLSSLSSLALAATAVVGVAATEGDALAGVHIHIGGGAHVHIGGAHGTIHWTVNRPTPPPMHIHVGGAIWVGGGVYYGPRFAPPPPPPTYYGCDCGGDYYPVQPTVGAAPVIVAAPTRQPLPRWGIGVAAGGVDVQGNHAGDDLALLGRFRLTPGLGIEGEVGKSSIANNERVDRRLGASLVYEFGAYHRWAPYVVGGMGVTQVDVGGGTYQSNQTFGEVGVGLRLSLTPHLDLAADIRAGSRKSSSNNTMPLDAAARAVAPSPDNSEQYTRGRLSAILYF